jgi:DNA-binding NarL/FixJ family response regulator
VTTTKPSRHPPLRAVIAHPTAAGRLALRMVMEIEDGLEIAAVAGDAKLAGRLAHELHAACIVIHDSLLARAQLGPLAPGTSLVVLGMEQHPEAAAAAKRNGATAYVQWDRASDDLPRTLRGLDGQS